MGFSCCWILWYDPASRKAQRLPVLRHHSYWIDLVKVLPGDYPQELGSVCCKLFPGHVWKHPALQDMEVQPRAQAEGSGSAADLKSHKSVQLLFSYCKSNESAFCTLPPCDLDLCEIEGYFTKKIISYLNSVTHISCDTMIVFLVFSIDPFLSFKGVIS